MEVQGAESLSVNQSHWPHPAKHLPHSQTARACHRQKSAGHWAGGRGGGMGCLTWASSRARSRSSPPSSRFPCSRTRKEGQTPNIHPLHSSARGQYSATHPSERSPASVTWGQWSCLPRVAVLNTCMNTGKALSPRPDSHSELCNCASRVCAPGCESSNVTAVLSPHAITLSHFYWSIVALSSTVQQSESAPCIHVSLPFWISFHSGHHTTPSRVPWAIQ